MRRRYLVAYDITDPKRLQRTFRALHGFGNAVQYSVFLCTLAPAERQLLRERLNALLNLREDRAMIIDLGEADARGSATFEVLGRQLQAMPKGYEPVII
jgi:CRISPR-associated protein Cas2